MANKRPCQTQLSNQCVRKRLSSSAYCYESHTAFYDFQSQEALQRKPGGVLAVNDNLSHKGSLQVVKIGADGQVIPSSQRLAQVDSSGKIFPAVLLPDNTVIEMSSRSGRNPKPKDGKTPIPKEDKTPTTAPQNDSGKGNTDPELPQEDVNDPAAQLTTAVITHFSSHWETFKSKCLEDVTNLAVLLRDPDKGLVKKVSTLEKNVTALNTRVTKLESAPSKVTTDPRVEEFITLCDKTNKNGLPKQLENLEKKVNTFAEIREDGEVVLKHPEITDIKEELSDLKEDVETITGFMHTMSKEVKSLRHRANMNSAKLMKNTLIFGGVRYQEEEPAYDALVMFLNNFMQLFPGDDDILDAERMGSGYTRWVEKKSMEITFPAPIKARCTEAFATKVMRNSYKLGGKEDEEFHFSYYVRPSMPEAHRAIRDKHYKDIKSFKERNSAATNDEPKISFFFNGEKFYVNGEIIEEDITPPTFRDMMAIDSTVQAKIDALTFAMSSPKDFNESTFQGFAVNIQSLEDVQIAYMKVRQIRKFADHIMVAYRFEDNGLKQGCAHDKEYYGDVEILNAIRKVKATNLAVFVAREYGGIPLGATRFEMIADVAENAISNLGPATLSQEPEDQPFQFRTQRRSQRRAKGRGGWTQRGGRGGGGGGGRGRGRGENRGRGGSYNRSNRGRRGAGPGRDDYQGHNVRGGGSFGSPGRAGYQGSDVNGGAFSGGNPEHSGVD